MHGKHLIGTVRVSDKSLLSSESAIKRIVAKFCAKAQLTVVRETMHLFENPAAITYCLILSQSHFIVHTWPEHATITFDLFTCSKDHDSAALGELFAREVGGSIMNEKIILV